jgi:hypothetical protein
LDPRLDHVAAVLRLLLHTQLVQPHLLALGYTPAAAAAAAAR